MHVQIVGLGLQDAEPNVRGQAAFALAQLAQHCQPEICSYAATALPHVLQALQDASPVVQEQAFSALVALAESLGANLLRVMGLRLGFEAVTCVLRPNTVRKVPAA